MAYQSKNPRAETTSLTDQGTTAVSNPKSGSHKYVNRSGAFWVRLSTGVEYPAHALSSQVSAQSASYTVLDNDNVMTVSVTTGSTARTVTLPTAADNTHRILTIIKADSGSGTVTVDGEGAETINGATTIVLTSQYDAITIQCTGTAWLVLNYAANATATVPGIVSTGTQTIAGDKTFSGTLTLGASATSGSTNTSHVLNSAVSCGATGTADAEKSLFFNANSYSSNFTARNSNSGTLGGAALAIRARSADSYGAFVYYANQAADGNTTAADIVGLITQSGAWTLGISGASSTVHSVNGGLAFNGGSTLSYYAEGSFPSAPTVTFSGGNGTLSYSAQTGTYTRIGRMVLVSINLAFSKGTASGNLTLSSLPFTAASIYAGAAAIDYTGIPASAPPITCSVAGGTTTANVWKNNGAGTASALTAADLSASTTMTWSFFYFV